MDHKPHVIIFTKFEWDMMSWLGYSDWGLIFKVTNGIGTAVFREENPYDLEVEKKVFYKSSSYIFCFTAEPL